MKKPNITKGEWRLYYPPTNASIQIKGIQNDIVCTIYNEANAKAISAVHEMLEELIECQKILEKAYKGHSLEKDELKAQITNNYYALKKAGCE